MRHVFKIGLIAVFCAAITYPSISAAQEDKSKDKVDYQPIKAEHAGIVGGILGGAEVTVIVEAIFGIHKLWPYLTFPIAGAVGGGIGGYYIDKNARVEVSVGMLAGSMILIIPTLIAASSAAKYHPEDEGVVVDDQDNQSPVFEKPLESEINEDKTTTEIESRPEGAPNSTTPPPTIGPPEPAPKEESKPTQVPEDQKKKDDSASGAVSSSADDSKAQSIQTARIRRATSGALFFVDSDGSASMSIPYFNVRPVAISFQSIEQKAIEGVEVIVPLLRVDLP